MAESEQKPTSAPPKLVSRRDNRNSSFRLGRTIGEKREKLETANERAVARKKDKNKKTLRIVFTLVGFLILAIILIALCFAFVRGEESGPVEIINEDLSPAPTIEIVDEDSTSTLSSRMTTYIGQVEQALRELGYKPIKAVVPSGSIREVDFYLDGYNGFIKMIIDRGAGVSAEDTDRMLRYLSEQGITDFAYIDVRINGKAYWK